MKTLNDYVREYKRQLQQGDIREGYRGLIKYMMDLKTYFKNEYPGYGVSGNIYQGYMDISHFTFTPPELKRQRLKIAIILNHEKVRFEVWLVGVNKQIQKRYWELFQGSDWDKYYIPPNPQDGFSILEGVLVEGPNFDNLPALTKQIEQAVLTFILDVVEVLGE